MNKYLKKPLLFGLATGMSILSFTPAIVNAETLGGEEYNIVSNDISIGDRYEIAPRYSSSTEDWRLESSSTKLISDTYTGILTKTSTTAFNAGINIKGFEFGASKTYSKSRQFKTYKRVREVTAKFAVYHRMGGFLRYQTETQRVTTIHHVAM